MIEQGQEWERLPFEHSRCYQAFAAYRDMGAERSLRELARRLNKSLTIVGRWSVHWEWQKRVGAYDAHMERIKLKAQEDERREMGIRQAREGQTLQQFAMAGIQMLLNEEGRPIEPIAPSVIARLLETGVKIERLGRGEPTENIDMQGTKVIWLPARVQSEEEWLRARDGNK